MSSGTQSPPLELTGEHQPVGAADKSGKPLPEGVKDIDQRAEYFGGNKTTGDTHNTGKISEEAIAGAAKSAQCLEERGRVH